MTTVIPNEATSINGLIIAWQVYRVDMKHGMSWSFNRANHQSSPQPLLVKIIPDGPVVIIKGTHQGLTQYGVGACDNATLSDTTMRGEQYGKSRIASVHSNRDSPIEARVYQAPFS